MLKFYISSSQNITIFGDRIVSPEINYSEVTKIIRMTDVLIRKGYYSRDTVKGNMKTKGKDGHLQTQKRDSEENNSANTLFSIIY